MKVNEASINSKKMVIVVFLLRHYGRKRDRPGLSHKTFFFGGFSIASSITILVMLRLFHKDSLRIRLDAGST